MTSVNKPAKRFWRHFRPRLSMLVNRCRAFTGPNLSINRPLLQNWWSYYDHNVCNNGLLMLRFGPVIALHLLTSILKRGRKCLQKRLVGLFTEVMRYYLIERRTT